MTILYPARRPVKPARPFGAGVLPAVAPRRPAVTPADRSWWAAESARIEAEREARELEALAAESAALDRLERGLCL